MMAIMAKRTLANQIRHLIETSGQTRYRIAVETDIDHGTLSRFMTGKAAGLSMANLDALADYLGWTIVAKARRPSSRTKKGK